MMFLPPEEERMRSRAVLFCLMLALSVGSVVAVASPINPIIFTGTQQPAVGHPNTGASSFQGVDCNPLGSGPNGICIPASSPRDYQPFYAKISGDPGTGVWTLEIQTNAPLDYGTSASKLAFGDALIKGGGLDPVNDPYYWGISIGSGQPEPVTSNLPVNPATTLGGNTNEGDLYEVALDGRLHPFVSYDAMYLTPTSPGANSSFQMVSSFGRGNEPIWINPGPAGSVSHAMNDVGTSSAFNIATPGCNSATPGGAVDSGDPNCGPSGHYQLYTITDTFTAPQAFSDMMSSGVLSFEFSSFVCANGLIISNGTVSSVPEPRTVSFLLIGMLLLGARLIRSRKAQVS
jgi:hypothetical protein